MSKRADISSFKAYPKSDFNSVETKRKWQRKCFIEGYEQAEKDTIERAISWVRKNAYIYTDTQNDEDGNLMIAFLEEAFIDDLKKAMEEE